ncbi:hypothetical N-acetyl-beta-hexosaminidase [Reinekea sp. MED297]|nr:hypothetical N-acetyl-beta-hexosaminidase [Reinekea sp. MED297] [Reinekea blandensis MED297]
MRHTIRPDTAECPEQFVFNGVSWNVGWLQRLLTRLSVNPSMVVSSGDEEAWQATAELDSSLDEAFALTVDARGAHLSYRSVAGFHQGQAVLFQYLMQWICIKTLPACEVRDTPEYDYRGIHLDVARHFFSADDIMAWWDVLALFQYNVFHWHLTDDDGWRIDSQTYPELTQIGAWRGPEEVLPPQMGSGHLRYGGSYSPDQVTELVERLAGLGVMVVPEMDLPGHSRALLKSLPDLVEDDDHSLYRSVQHYHDNVINPAYGPTMDYLETLIKEWCALFPGELFHLGCDEVPAGAWSESPSARQASEQGHGTPLTQLVENVKQLLAAEGKTLAGWEEIAEGQPAPETWVYSWQGVKAGQAAAEKGHPVVMTPAQHCYLDLAVTDAIDDPGYWWAGTVDMRQVYEYQPTAGLSAE